MMYWLDHWIQARQLLANDLALDPRVDGVYRLETWADAYSRIDQERQNIMKLMVDVAVDGGRASA